MKFLNIFLHLILLSQLSSFAISIKEEDNKIIELPVSVIDENYLPGINVGFENGKNNQVVALDLNVDYSWLFKDLYTGDMQQCENQNEISFNSHINKLQGKKIKEDIILNGNEEKNLAVKDFEFMLVSKIDGPKQYLGAININLLNFNYSLNLGGTNKYFAINKKGSLKINDNYDSFSHKVEPKKLVEIPLTKNTHQLITSIQGIFIGKIDITDEKTNYTIKTNPQNGIKEKFYEINSENKMHYKDYDIYFASSINTNYVSAGIWNFLKNNYFQKDNKFKPIDDIYYYPKKNIKEIKPVNFMLDNDVVITLNSEDLLNCQITEEINGEVYCQYNINKKASLHHIILGFSLMKNYDWLFLKQNEKNKLFIKGNFYKAFINNNYLSKLITNIKDHKVIIKELIRTLIVILIIFAICFTSFFVADKCCGTKKDEKDKEENNIEQPLQDIDTKENK